MTSHGIAMADHFLAQHELSTGNLVPAVHEIHPSGESYYLVYRHKLAGDSRLKNFSTWLKAALAAAIQKPPALKLVSSRHLG